MSNSIEKTNNIIKSKEEIKKVVDINVSGMVIGTSVALTQLKKQGYGRVYNMEGLGSNNMKIAKTLVYGGSKRFLSYFSQGCNKELKEFNSIFCAIFIRESGFSLSSPKIQAATPCNLGLLLNSDKIPFHISKCILLVPQNFHQVGILNTLE